MQHSFRSHLLVSAALAALGGPAGAQVQDSARGVAVSQAFRTARLPGATALPPDIVVVVIDDVADTDIDAVQSKGWLPNISALAASGVRFRRAYSHAKCHPTRDSMMYSQWLGIDRGDSCAPPVPGLTHSSTDLSLYEVMDGRGYSTLHVGKWHTGTAPFGPFELAANLAGADAARQVVPVGTTCTDLSPGPTQYRIDDGVGAAFTSQNTVALRDAFIDWWLATPPPRFAIVNFGAAHEPFKYPPSELLPPGYPSCGLVNCSNRKEYEAEIVGVDTALGEIMAFTSGAYVVFLADNGTPGIVPHKPPSVTDATRPDQDPERVKLSAYEDGVRIPLIIAGPGVIPSESSALVHVVDLMPTLARITGDERSVSASSGLIDGRSFAACLIGLPGPRDHVFVWEGSTPAMALIERRWKLLTNPAGVEEFYDLNLGEQTPIASNHPDYVANYPRLRQRRDLILSGSGR